MGIAFIPLYIQYLGIEAYGVIGVFALIQSWLFLLDMGITPTLSREMARFDAGDYKPQNICDLVRSLELIYICISFIISITLWMGSTWLSSNWLKVGSFPKEEVANALALTGIFISLRWFSGLYRGALVGLQEQVWLNLSNSIFGTIRGFGVVIILAWISPTLFAFLVFQIAVALLEVLVLAIKMHKLLPSPPKMARFCLASLRKVWKFSAGISLNMLQILFLTQVDKLILSKFLPLAEFGYYTLATTLVSGLYVAMGAITNVAYPRFTQLISLNNIKDLIGNYHKFSQLLAITIVPAAIVVSFFSENIMLLWTKDSSITVAVAPLVSLLIIGNMINGLTQTPYFLQLAYGWTRLNILANFCSIVVTLPLLYLAIPKYGAIAAPIIGIMMNCGFLILTIPVMHIRLLRTEMWFWYKNTAIFPIITALTVISIVYYLAPAPAIEYPLENIGILSIASIVGLVATVLSTPFGRSQFKIYLRWN